MVDVVGQGRHRPHGAGPRAWSIMRPETLALVAQRRRQEGRRAGDRPHRRHHGGQEDPRADPAVPSAAAHQGRGRPRRPDEALPGIRVTAEVRTRGQTGVEMEALTAVSVACLTIYDMVKAVERGMRIEGVRLVEKAGGAPAATSPGTRRDADLGRGRPAPDAGGCRGAAGRDRRPRRRPRPGAGRGRRRPPHPAAVRCLGDGRLRRAPRRYRRGAGPAAADRRPRRPAIPSPAGWRRARRCASSPAPSCPKAPTPS